MPYPRRLLNEGEDIALDLRPHWWFFSRHVLTGIPLFVVGILLFTWSTDSSVKDFAGWVWGALAIVWALWVALQYGRWVMTQFVVTNRRVIYRWGIVSKHGVEIPLERINNINFHQGVFLRVIGAGDLTIESAGAQGQSEFDNVNHPDAVQQEIYRQMERNTREQAQWSVEGIAARVAAPDGTDGSAPSIPEQIRQLSELREAGAISDAEFESKKAELLDRM